MADNEPISQPYPLPSGMQRQKQRLKVSSILLLIYSVFLVGSAIYLGLLVIRQIQTLEANVQITENIINANVRTLGQLQRELLRLMVLLESGENDPQALDLQRSFVRQRVQEATLSYQLQTLGTEALLEESRALAGRWENDIEPLIEEILLDPDNGDTSLRAEASARLVELELAYNQLIAEGEINRKQQAGLANDATIRILSSNRTLILGLSIVILGFFIFVGIVAGYYYRFDRQREAMARELVQLNTEMRKLSQVASRTDNMVIITGAGGRVEWVNAAFSRITGYALDEIISRELVVLLQGPKTSPAIVQELAQALRQGEGFKCEALSYTQSGQGFWSAIEIQPVHDDQGALTHFIAVVIDLSEQRRRERTIARNSQLLDVINQAQKEFILTSTPGIMFEKLLESLLEMTESEYGFIGEVLQTEAGEPYLKTHAITNIAWSEETHRLYAQQAAGGMEFYNLKTLFGAALTTQKPVIANHPATDPRSGGMPAGHPAMNAFLGLPFFNAGQEMVGLVGIANRPQGYDEEMVAFLGPFLATCGNLIEAYRNENRRRAAEAALVTLNDELEKRTEEATEQRDFALQIMNTMGQGLTVVDENSRFTFVNPAYAEMVREKPEDLIGRTPFEFTELADRDVLKTAGTKRAQGQISTYETRIQRADGQLVDVLITGVPRYRQGAFAGSIAVITNLTEQKRVESALRKSEAEARKLSQVASRTDNLVIIADAAGYVEWVNAAFTRVTGYTLEETRGRRPGDLLQGPETDPATVAFMRERLQKGEGFNVEVLNYSRKGRPYWVEIEVQPVRDAQGSLTNFIAIETDITERRQAEEHLRQAKEAAEEAALAKAAFLASMSHEIRTPLNAVIGLNSLLLNTPLTEQQRQFAETARSSGSLLMMLINNVLDFSALESGRVDLTRQPFQFQRSLHEIIELLQHEADRKGLSLSYAIDAAVPPVLVGDETRLRQVLLNLIGNSIKFTDAGEIAVAVTASVEGETARLRIAVRDTGIGIPPDRLDRLFQPFTQIDATTTRKYGGSGLGLAISKMIVNMMGGEIGVESEVGRGTTFTFSVQMAVGDPNVMAAPAAAIQLNEEMGRRWPLRILLVEDDRVNQQVAVHMLEQLGYQADVASSGLEALDALQSRSYDAIFMDIHMPDMDGITATRRLYETRAADRIPFIIAMTASALEGDRERFMAAGMHDYVSKPVELEAIAAALMHAVEKQKGDLPAVSFQEQPVEAGPPTAVDEEMFRKRLGSGKEALLRKLVGLFVAEAERLLPELGQAAAAGDAARTREVAHQLKGSSAGVAAVRFAGIAGDLERQAHQGDLAGAADLIDDLSRELAAVIAWQKSIP